MHFFIKMLRMLLVNKIDRILKSRYKEFEVFYCTAG